MRRIAVLGALACIATGCGASKPSPTPPEALLLKTGAAQYSRSGHTKVDSATCKHTSAQSYSCEMRYSFTPPSGKRTQLQTTVPVSCVGRKCAASWLQATEGATPGQAASASTTTPGLPKKIALLEQCENAEGQYLKLGAAVQKFGSNASQAVYGSIVANADTMNTDLIELAPHASADQQAQLTQYEGVLTQLETGMRDAAAGDLQSADEAITGVGQQIGKIPTLIGQICRI